MKKKQLAEVDIGMSSLIDCVFLLLIFFLVATMLKKEKRDIDITPPESASAVRMLPDDDVLVLGVDSKGTFFYQGEETTLSQLHQRLREVAIEDSTRRIRLDADHETPFASVVQILDLCQFDGLTNVGIRTYDERYNR